MISIEHLRAAAVLLLLQFASLVANAQCQTLPRQFIGAELGGARSYATGLTVRTVPFGPASNRAGIDMVSGSGSSVPNQNANVHWYKDEIIAVHLSWRPRTPAELTTTKDRLLRLSGVPPSASLGIGEPIALRCSGGIVGTIALAEIVPGGTAPNDPVLSLNLTHPKQATMMQELRGKDTRMPGPP